MENSFPSARRRRKRDKTFMGTKGELFSKCFPQESLFHVFSSRVRIKFLPCSAKGRPNHPLDNIYKVCECVLSWRDGLIGNRENTHFLPMITTSITVNSLLLNGSEIIIIYSLKWSENFFSTFFIFVSIHLCK